MLILQNKQSVLQYLKYISLSSYIQTDRLIEKPQLLSYIPIHQYISTLGRNKKNRNKLGLSLDSDTNKLWLITQPALVGAKSFVELQLRIHRYNGMVWWMKCKLRFALVGYLLAKSQLSTSWAWLLGQPRLELESWPSCSLESTGLGGHSEPKSWCTVP